MPVSTHLLKSRDGFGSGVFGSSALFSLSAQISRWNIENKASQLEFCPCSTGFRPLAFAGGPDQTGAMSAQLGGYGNELFPARHMAALILPAHSAFSVVSRAHSTPSGILVGREMMCWSPGQAGG